LANLKAEESKGTKRAKKFEKHCLQID
jgi:hypothetical protein